MAPSDVLKVIMYCGCKIKTGKLPLGLPYLISLQYQSKPSHLSSLSVTMVTTLWLNNQLVFAVK